jgi:hypothetical protein
MSGFENCSEQCDPQSGSHSPLYCGLRPQRVVLGASDPEMSRIRELAELAGIEVVQATSIGRDGNPVPVGGPATYKATSPTPQVGDAWIETAPAEGGKAAIIAAGGVVVDHHEVGDPGYGRPPAEAFSASSIGQIFSRIGFLPRREDMVIAACDHCLTAAYAGMVPGVSPDVVLAMRVANAARFEGRSEADVREDIERALRALESAPTTEIGGEAVADLREWMTPAKAGASDQGGLPALNHAGPMTGRAYIALVREAASKGGRLKVVLGGDGPGTATDGHAAAGFAEWAAKEGLIDAYGGDPARGFAGAYVRED